MKEKPEKGVVYTPPEAARDLVRMFSEETILDPTTHLVEPWCGTGNILLELADYMYNILSDTDSSYCMSKEHALAEVIAKCTAFDTDDNAVRICRIRLLSWVEDTITREHLNTLEVLRWTAGEIITRNVETRSFETWIDRLKRGRTHS